MVNLKERLSPLGLFLLLESLVLVLLLIPVSEGSIDAFGPNCGHANLQSFELQEHGFPCTGRGGRRKRDNSSGNLTSELEVEIDSDAASANGTLDLEIGAEDEEGSSRMSAGYTPSATEFPSYIRVLANWQEGNSIHGGSCGGTLVHKNVAITAGHCLAPYDKKVTSFRIVANQNDRRSSAGSQSANVVAACMPDKSLGPDIHYAEKHNLIHRYFSHDFAVLKLDRQVSYNQYVQPACLDLHRRHNPSATCVIAGYGIINNQQATVNQKRALPMREVQCPSTNLNSACWETVDPKKYAGNICSGDSGSGIFCFDKCSGQSKTYVVGSVSNAFVNSCVPGQVHMSQFMDTFKLRNVISKCVQTLNTMQSGNGILWKQF